MSLRTTAGLSELQGLALAQCVEGAVIEDDAAIADGVGDAPVQQVAIKWAPATLALNEGGCHTIRFHGADDSDVGLVARTQETSISNAEQLGWLVAHQVDDAFERDNALVDEAEHGGQRELHHRHA